MSSSGFAAGQIEELLVDLATRAAVDGRTGAIRVVGGSAIALMNADRRATHDIDAVLAALPTCARAGPSHCETSSGSSSLRG